MIFSKKLNNYIKLINCSSKDLSSTSSISPAVISRYRNGERTPKVNSVQLEQLSNGIYKIAVEKGIDLSKEVILKELSNTLSDIVIDFEQLRKNLNDIISVLNINISELSRGIGFDSSMISKIRSGKRNPANIGIFVDSICNFIVRKYKSDTDKKAICSLIECNYEDILISSNYLDKLKKWFSLNATSSHNYINDFFKNLNEFDLEQYIKAIKFDEMKVPSLPFYKSSSKTYYGIEEMKQGELDFFKATVLSKSNDSIFMCSNMPMEDMAKDVDFGKKWMFAIAMTLKKGLHLNIIHNINRPFNEMMLGLESWIPIYMTGQVSPYYLSGFQDNTYCHFNYVSGSIALAGECINGYHNKGKYHLTSNKSDIAYYKEKVKCLLNKAKPLMDIYRIDSKNSFNAFIMSDSNIKGNHRRIFSSLPIHTISDDLLLKILKRNNLSDKNIESIIDSVNNERQVIKSILKENFIEDEISEFSKEEFEKHTPSLSLSDTFYENKISYNYDEYLEHLKYTKKYNNSNKNYKLSIDNTNAFRNIDIDMNIRKWVKISKNVHPTIHFVIHNPKLRNAIENFVVPVIE